MLDGVHPTFLLDQVLDRVYFWSNIMPNNSAQNQTKNEPRSYDRNFYNCVKKPEKNSGLQRGLNPWPRDTGATLYQLSYEATDVGSRSILGSYVPVKDM